MQNIDVSPASNTIWSAFNLQCHPPPSTRSHRWIITHSHPWELPLASSGRVLATEPAADRIEDITPRRLRVCVRGQIPVGLLMSFAFRWLWICRSFAIVWPDELWIMCTDIWDMHYVEYFLFVWFLVMKIYVYPKTENSCFGTTITIQLYNIYKYFVGYYHY